MLKNRKGQAAVELAVLGSLIIVAFSYLMLYSERINLQQAHLMQTFRESLQKAKAENTSVSYSDITHRRMANISNPYTLGQLETLSDSASVMWTDGKNSNSTGKSFVKVNGVQVQSSVGETAEEEEAHYPQGFQEHKTFTTNTSGSSTYAFTKAQSQGATLVTARSLYATDQLDISSTSNDPQATSVYSGTFYLGPGGRYYSDSSQALSRSRTWNTQN